MLCLLLCITTVGSYKKYKQKIDILSFIISLSPLIFIVVLFIIALSGAPLAPKFVNKRKIEQQANHFDFLVALFIFIQY